jgi:4-amino-4-deoxy-L-arabinose transferase-like glycosyltransferase
MRSRQLWAAHGWAAVAILFLGFLIRTHDLTGTPPGIDGDEMFYFTDASSVLRGEWKIYFPTNFGHEPLFIYAEAFFLNLLGNHAFALRYTAVVGGLLSLAICYALAHRLFNSRVALTATALFATLFYPVFLTRIGLRAFTLPLFAMFSVYAVWRTLHERSWRWSVAAGIFNGLMLYTYTSARIFPAVILIWLAALLILDRKLLIANLTRLALIAGVAAALMAPFVTFALAHPDVVNQRLNTMGGPYFEIQRGEFKGLIENLGKVAGMFTFAGEADNRYNFNGQPIFDPASGLLFYLGALVGLWSLRRPAYALIFIWLGVMLMPTVLAVGAPSFLRTCGALFPIVVLPGLGLDWIVARLPQLNWRRWFAPIVVGGGLVLGAVTASAMFGPWRLLPQVMGIYESDLHFAARYLDDHPPAPGTSAFIVAGYAADNAPIIFGLQSRTDPPVRWTTNFVWPHGGGEALYLFSQESLPDAEVRSWLAPESNKRGLGAPIEQVHDGEGRTVLEVYRANLPEPPAPKVEAAARFDQLLDLIGVSYPESVERGGAAAIKLFFRVARDFKFDPADPPNFRLRLENDGIVWTQESGLMAFPPGQWRAGDVWVQAVMVKPPVTMPPQAIPPELTIYTRERSWPVIPQGEEIARSKLALPPLRIAGQPLDPIPPGPRAQRFGAALALLSANNTPSAGPGAPVFVDVHWRALNTLDQDYAAQLQLVNAGGSVIATATRTIWQGLYPTRHWQEGEEIASKERIQVPADAANGDYEVRLRIVEEDGEPIGEGAWVTTGRVQVSGAPKVFVQPRVEVPLDVEFETAARLVGYRLNLDEARPGGSIKLTLVWQAAAPTPTPFKVFTHLYNLQNTVEVFAQHDNLLANGATLTTSWAPGEYLEDEHVIVLNPSLPRGEYRLGVGMYDPDLPRRLTLVSSEGALDALILTRVTVR